MNKYLYTLGTALLALMIGVLPAAALAENGGSEGSAVTQVAAQVQDTDVSVSVTARAGESGDEENKIEEQKDQPRVANLGQDDDEAVGEDQDELELEDDEDVAFSLDDLKQKIGNRRLELDDEEASTTPKFKDAMKNANEVRLAVHALLASRGLLGGGIGQQVSEIAKGMNDSVASTTNAEAKMQSRGFLMRLFFGGDSAMADVIAQAVAKNQTRIDDLNKLLGEANVPADIQTVLKAQITALQTAQARLQALAEREQKMWGLFSWRF